MPTEIKFSDTISIWKSTYSFEDKKNLVEFCETHVKDVGENNPDSLRTNAFSYSTIFKEVKTTFEYECNNELDRVIQFGINECINLFRKTNDYEFVKLNFTSWINLVKINPVQQIYTENGELIFHKHTEISKRLGQFKPLYTFVIYIQMPNNLKGDDGVLFFKDYDETLFKYLPKEGDCIIMNGDVDHVPNHALNSTVDRIVIAGNVLLEKIKDKTSLI